MLFRSAILTAIASGNVTLAFRRWKKPTVKAGGTLLTAIGQLGIEAVDEVALDAISAVQAKRAGFTSLAALKLELNKSTEGRVYRIRLGKLRADPRIALRARAALSATYLDALSAKLSGIDARSRNGPWTLQALQAIRDYPGLRARDLCQHVNQERLDFKINVRKLKQLGLTESLEVGYRLSKRGEALLPSLQQGGVSPRSQTAQRRQRGAAKTT